MQLENRWASIIGLTFLIEIIFSIESEIVYFIRSSCSLMQCPSVSNPLAVYSLLGELFSFLVMCLIVTFLTARYKIFSRLVYDRWLSILFVNGNGLWLYTVIINLATCFYASDLTAMHSGSMITLLGILYGFNDFISVLAKLMLIGASTRFLLAIKPVSETSSPYET